MCLCFQLFPCLGTTQLFSGEGFEDIWLTEGHTVSTLITKMRGDL
jgi:hypothetical protein